MEPQAFGLEPHALGVEPHALGVDPQAFGFDPQAFPDLAHGFSAKPVPDASRLSTDADTRQIRPRRHLRAARAAWGPRAVFITALFTVGIPALAVSRIGGRWSIVLNEALAANGL